MQNLVLNDLILYGVEPRLYNLFSDLVDITHKVIFNEIPLNTRAPHEPLFNNPRDDHIRPYNNHQLLIYI